MSRFIIAPKHVNEYLKRPYNLKEAWDKACLKGKPPKAGDFLYSDKEISLIQGELSRIYNQLTANCTPITSDQTKHFVLSAGAPGAGKSTLLENLLVQEPYLRNMVFSDPDERALKLMQLYKRDIEHFGGGLNGSVLSYTKWRWASNYISGTIINKANDNHYNILLGTTGTSPFISTLYDNVHNENYKTTTIIVCAPYDVRIESSRKRFETEKNKHVDDAKEKGKLFYERISTIFDKTNDFMLYWRGEVDNAPTLAAYTKNGIIHKTDTPALSAIDVDFSNNSNLSWPILENIYLQKFTAN